MPFTLDEKVPALEKNFPIHISENESKGDELTGEEAKQQEETIIQTYRLRDRSTVKKVNFN